MAQTLLIRRGMCAGSGIPADLKRTADCSEEGGSRSSELSGTDHCRNTMPDQEALANFIAQMSPDS